MSEIASRSSQTEPRSNIFARCAAFIRAVIDELRKVVWPTKNELWTYFFVVIVFITAIMAFTGALDFIFDRLVLWALA